MDNSEDNDNIGSSYHTVVWTVIMYVAMVRLLIYILV